jgi:copper chaperone CopZ
MTRKEYTIPNMECSMCVIHLEALEDELKGVHKIEASYPKQRMIVEYDEKIIREEQIIKAIQEIGYTVLV